MAVKWQPKKKAKKAKKPKRRKWAIKPIDIPFTRDELRQQAMRDVDLEISEATGPLGREGGILESRRAGALGGLESLYSSILPYAAQSAERQRQVNEQSLEAEKGIFAAAKQRLDSMRANQAGEAQKMAQTLGAPVPVEGFTAPIEAAGGDLENLGAGEMLETMGLGQADVAAAEAFSGRVLPMMKAEEEGRTRRGYDEQISKLKSEIAQIKSQRGRGINKRYADLLTQEREFALQQLQGNRDYQIAQGTLGLQTSGQEFEQQFAYDQLAQEANISYAQLGADVAAQNQERTDQLRTNANELLSAYISPEIETANISQPFPAGPGETPDFIGDDGQGYIYKTINVRTDQPAVKNPNRLYELLTSQGIPKKMAQNMIRRQLGLKGWVYGQQPGEGKKRGSGRFTYKQLQKMSSPRLVQIARARGFRGKGKSTNKAKLIAWILGHPLYPDNYGGPN